MVFRPRGKRGEPKTYAVQQLTVTSGFGAFSAQAGGAGIGSGNRGYRWALITGLVPVAEQTDAYFECFRDAFPQQKDGPKYAYYEVERAEVKDQTTDSSNLQWVQLNLDKAYEIPKEWSGSTPELVARKFIDEDVALVYPLGPLANRAWDASVAHPPEIPVNAEGGGSPVAPPTDAPPTDAQPPAASPEPAPHEGPHRFHRPGSPVQPSSESAVPAKSEEAAAKSDEIKYLLFRYFDFTAEPGKRYRYRVQLNLKNPNFGIETRWLQDPGLANKEYLSTRWSDPTDVVAIARDDRLLLVGIKPARGSVEPLERFELLKWINDQGMLVSKEKEVHRGQLMNFAKEDAIPVSAPAAAAAGVAAAAPAADSLLDAAPSPTTQPAGHQVDFQTGLMLIDMRGGERQPGRDRTATEPAEALLLDSDGSLVVRAELSDSAEWQRTTTVKPPENHLPRSHLPRNSARPGTNAVPGPDTGLIDPNSPTPAAKPSRPVRRGRSTMPR
jgi:hypothetical protein